MPPELQIPSVGEYLGGYLGDFGSSVADALMMGIWAQGLAILSGALQLADQFGTFTVSTQEGPVAVLWPVLKWLSGAIALGLFFLHLAKASLRGGRGFLRTISGPVQYGVAMAATVSTSAALLAVTNEMTDFLLSYGLHVDSFQQAFHSTSILSAAANGVHGTALGLIAIFGVIPAALGFALEMLFREAAILLLIGTSPVAAAGLLADGTATWFWVFLRWLLAAMMMEPALALVIVEGVAIFGGAQGLPGVMVGVGVLIIALFMPLLLFRLLAFVDPRTDAGAAFRQWLSSHGVDSFGPQNPAREAEMAAIGGAYRRMTGGGASSDGHGSFDLADDVESAHTGRFEQAQAGEPAPRSEQTAENGDEAAGEVAQNGEAAAGAAAAGAASGGAAAAAAAAEASSSDDTDDADSSTEASPDEQYGGAPDSAVTDSQAPAQDTSRPDEPTEQGSDGVGDGGGGHTAGSDDATSARIEQRPHDHTTAEDNGAAPGTDEQPPEDTSPQPEPSGTADSGSGDGGGGGAFGARMQRRLHERWQPPTTDAGDLPEPDGQVPAQDASPPDEPTGPGSDGAGGEPTAGTGNGSFGTRMQQRLHQRWQSPPADDGDHAPEHDGDLDDEHPDPDAEETE
ncbi:hypothetical protein [Saccharopolyspora elongata]|uniref:TrbL/VirB6 plasmid conjugal transfer protein n=1 Tax=Saccharopolyspora elongata TaxID=2530387 RepID=A0A4R4Y283_9PSEU|nr:hypothetical protein [Saccharopolyspora elongata]TDD37780.1 hypothetical protein E1288_39945 [Saccharopolyspora elongata]